MNRLTESLMAALLVIVLLASLLFSTVLALRVHPYFALAMLALLGVATSVALVLARRRAKPISADEVRHFLWLWLPSYVQIDTPKSTRVIAVERDIILSVDVQTVASNGHVMISQTESEVVKKAIYVASGVTEETLFRGLDAFLKASAAPVSRRYNLEYVERCEAVLRKLNEMGCDDAANDGYRAD